MDKHDQLIEKSAQLLELAKEYKESVLYQNSLYHAVALRQGYGLYNEPERFLLIEISTSKEVAYGTPSDCRKYLERRNIPSDKVYEYKNIEKKPLNTSEDGTSH